MKENLHFKQLRLNYINNQKWNNKKKEHIRLAIAFIGVDVIAKTDDGIYILSIIKIYSLHLFSLLCQRRSCCWKYWKWCCYFENPYHHVKITDKTRINFLVSLYCTLLFYRKEMTKFSYVALVFVHCDRARISVLKYCQYYSGYLLACRKRQ